MGFSGFVGKRAIGVDGHGKDVFFDGDGVVEVAFAVHELLESCHGVIGDFLLSLQFGVEDDVSTSAIGHEGYSSFAEGVDEDTEGVSSSGGGGRFVHSGKTAWPGLENAASGFGLRVGASRCQPGLMVPRRSWTKDELLIVLNLYHKLTFGQLHARQPAIIALADKLGRGANSVAMKLSNLASLDPALKLRGIKGLAGASSLDKEVWSEFHAHLNEAAPASEEGLRKLFGAAEGDVVEVLPKEGIRVRKRPPQGPTETVVQVKQRRGQEYFRDAVLNNYSGRCGITSLGVRELLIASHILPWNSHPSERLNVRNGIALSRLHDAAFDRGLISFDDGLKLVLSPRLKSQLPQKALADNFGAYEGQPLVVPDDAVLPELSFVAEHRLKIFIKN